MERAEAMSKLDSAAISLDQLKDLQASWKRIGVTDRRDDQKAWKAFQKACDDVFAKHKQKIDESRAQEKEQSDAAKKIISSIKALAKTEAGSAPDEAALNTLQAEYAELPELHPSVQKTLDRDIQKAVDSVKASKQKFLRHRQQKQWLEMQRRAEICANIERLDPAKDGSKVEKLLEDWLLDPLSPEFEQIMESRKEKALAKKFLKADFDPAERERRLICIELEILLSKTSPEEDKSLRMEYQINSLKNKGLGANSNTDRSALIEGLLKRWYQISTASKAVQVALDERFHALVDKN